MNQENQHLQETALRLAIEASQEVMAIKNRGEISKNRKADNSWVTEADLSSDRIIREGLNQAFPHHGILTEEAGISGDMNSEWIWLIDPLDGTKAYAKGIPGFSVMIGLLKAGQPYLGVVVDPTTGFIYQAIRGQGTFLTQDGQTSRVHVSNRNEFSKMPLVVSTGFPEEKMSSIKTKLASPLCDPINSVGIKVGLVVRQAADIYISHHSVHYWDTCAPQVILEESGGFFSALDGAPLIYDLSGGTDKKDKYSHGHLTLATNNIRHAELSEILSPLFSQQK